MANNKFMRELTLANLIRPKVDFSTFKDGDVSGYNYAAGFDASPTPQYGFGITADGYMVKIPAQSYQFDDGYRVDIPAETQKDFNISELRGRYAPSSGTEYLAAYRPMQKSIDLSYADPRQSYKVMYDPTQGATELEFGNPRKESRWGVKLSPDYKGIYYGAEF